MRPIIPLEDIMARRTKKGGWTRADLARWGISWPPPRGWKAMLTGDAPTSEWIALWKALRALEAIEATTTCPKARDIARAAITEAEATGHNTTVKMPTKGEAAQKPTHQPAARARAW
jgi:hypothetical protein